MNINILPFRNYILYKKYNFANFHFAEIRWWCLWTKFEYFFEKNPQADFE